MYYHVDDPGWQPIVPDPGDEAARVREYLAHLAALQEENLRPIREALLKEQRR